MAIVKQRIYHKFGKGQKDYKIVHIETSSDIVMRTDGTKTVEEGLTDLENFEKRIDDRFDEQGVLKKEHGGIGNSDGTADKLSATHTFVTNLASKTPGQFDGTQDVTLGVTGTLPVENGGTGMTTLAGALNALITGSTALSSTGLATNDYVGIADSSDGLAKKVTIQNLATFISTLITTPPFIASATAPSNTTVFWLDTSSSMLKYYNGSSWVPVPVGYT